MRFLAHPLSHGVLFPTVLRGRGAGSAGPPSSPIARPVGVRPQAHQAAAAPPRPSVTNDQPQVDGGRPGVLTASRTRPKTSGAIAPAPKPRSERSASAEPRYGAPTASVSAVESTGESPRAVKP